MPHRACSVSNEVTIVFGSFISNDDVREILHVEDEDLAQIPFQDVDGVSVVDERDLQLAWYGGTIPNAPTQGRSSLDELILRRLISAPLPGVEIEPQHRVGRFTMDLKVRYQGTEKYIEFDGPHHFAPGRYGPPKHHPFRKKEIVEDRDGIEVVNWAYWIQRCSSNVEAIFDSTKKGLGALKFKFYSNENPNLASPAD